MHKYDSNGRFLDAITIVKQMRIIKPMSLEHKMNHAILAFVIGQSNELITLAEEIFHHKDLIEYLRKHEDSAFFLIDVIKRLEKEDPSRATKFCSELNRSLDNTHIAKGECHFLMARLTLETERELGLNKALNYLISAGQQNSIYIRKWYLIDPIFQQYHRSFDPELIRIFSYIKKQE